MRSLLLLMLVVYIPNVTSALQACNYIPGHVGSSSSGFYRPTAHGFSPYFRSQKTPETFISCNATYVPNFTLDNGTYLRHEIYMLDTFGSFSVLKITNVTITHRFQIGQRFYLPLSWITWLFVNSPILTTFNLTHYHGILTNLSRVDITNSEKNVDITLSSDLILDSLYVTNTTGINFDCESFKSSKLKNLQIENAQHVDMNFDCLPPEMETLKLIDCNLQNGFLVSTNEFKHHQHLVHFELRGNKDLSYIYIGLDTEYLPTSIRTLNLNDNGFTSFSTDQLTRLDKLRELNLANNDLRSLDIATLPTSIETLNLNNNNNLELDLSPLPKLVNMQDLYLAGITAMDGKSLQEEYHPDSQPSLYELVHDYVTTTTVATTTTTTVATTTTTTVATTTTTVATTANDNNEKEKPEVDDDVKVKGGDVADEQPEGGDVAEEQPEGGDAADKKPEGDEDEELEGGETASGSSSNHVTMPLIIVICVRFIATLL